MKKVILITNLTTSFLFGCTENESSCGNKNLKITDFNGNVIDCIEVPEQPNF